MQAVYRLELGHQRRHARTPRLLRWLSLIVLGIGAGAALWVVALELGAGANLMRTLPVRQPDWRQVSFLFFFAAPVGLLVPITLIFQLYTLLVTLFHASGSLTREKSGGTWEPLVLTRLNTWQILSGKAWATFRHLLPNYLLLALLRYSLIVSWALTQARSRGGFLQPSQYWFMSYEVPVTLLLVIALSVLAFTLLSLLITISFGLLGALLNWKNSVVLAFVLLIVVLALVGGTLVAGGTATLDIFAPVSEVISLQDTSGKIMGIFQPGAPQLGTPEWYVGDTLRDTGRTLLDGGLSLHTRWITEATLLFFDVDGATHPLFSGYSVPAALLAYLLLTALVMVAARRTAIKQGGA